LATKNQNTFTNPMIENILDAQPQLWCLSIFHLFMLSSPAIISYSFHWESHAFPKCQCPKIAQCERSFQPFCEKNVGPYIYPLVLSNILQNSNFVHISCFRICQIPTPYYPIPNVFFSHSKQRQICNPRVFLSIKQSHCHISLLVIVYNFPTKLILSVRSFVWDSIYPQ